MKAMRKSLILYALVLLGAVSCAYQQRAAPQSNRVAPTEPPVRSELTRNAAGWTRAEVPLDKPADVITFGSAGRVAIAGQGILLLSLDSGKTWLPVREGKGTNKFTTDGGQKYQNEFDVPSINLDKLCSVESAVFTTSGRLYLSSTCDHSSALWSVPTVNLSDIWHVRGFAPSPEQDDGESDYSSPGRNLVTAGRRVLVDARISGETALLTTDDEGATWHSFWRDSHAGRIVGVDFVDEHQGWMLQGNGKLLRTQDGGSTWLTVSALPSDAAGRVYAIDFINTTTGFVVGEEGLILTTKDGARSWQQQVSNTKKSLHRVVAASEKKVWGAGEDGTLLESDNGGVSWRKIALGVDEDIRALTVKDGVAWVIIGKNLYRSP